MSHHVTSNYSQGNWYSFHTKIRRKVDSYLLKTMNNLLSQSMDKIAKSNRLFING